jgi:hypothetical protein
MSDKALTFKPYWIDPETGGGGTQKAIEILNHHAVGMVVLVRSEHRSTIIRRLDVLQDLPDVNDLFGPAQS